MWVPLDRAFKAHGPGNLSREFGYGKFDACAYIHMGVAHGL